MSLKSKKLADIKFNSRIFAILFGIFALGSFGLSQDAYAIFTEINGETSCNSVPGGVWDTNLSFCSLTADVTVPSLDAFQITGVFVSIDPGVTVTVEQGGFLFLDGFATLSNSGTVFNHGDIIDTRFFLPDSSLDNFGNIHNFGSIFVGFGFNDTFATINSCGGSEVFDTGLIGPAVTNDCPCVPPISGDWIINYSCQMDTAELVNGDLIVHNGKVLTLGATGILDVSGDVIVENLSGINILNGATFWIRA